MHVCDPVERIVILLENCHFFWRNRATGFFATSWEAPQITPEHADVVQTDPGIAPITGSRFSHYCNGDHVLERWDQSRSNSKGGRIQLHVPYVDLPL